MEGCQLATVPEDRKISPLFPRDLKATLEHSLRVYSVMSDS